ncbi:unnamed protein product [Ectocarpus sp. 12 AP-2014]
MDNNCAHLYTCKCHSFRVLCISTSRLDGVLAGTFSGRLRLHRKTRDLIRIIPA